MEEASAHEEEDMTLLEVMESVRELDAKEVHLHKLNEMHRESERQHTQTVRERWSQTQEKTRALRKKYLDEEEEEMVDNSENLPFTPLYVRWWRSAYNWTIYLALCSSLVPGVSSREANRQDYYY